MIERINSIINLFDIGDIKFFILVAKKNIKNLIALSTLIALLALFISLNQEKKFLSKGIIVIEPDDNKIVNIERGNIVLFPSSLFHSTLPFNSKEKRVTLAFDIIPKV